MSGANGWRVVPDTKQHRGKMLFNTNPAATRQGYTITVMGIENAGLSIEEVHAAILSSIGGKTAGAPKVSKAAKAKAAKAAGLRLQMAQLEEEAAALEE